MDLFEPRAESVNPPSPKPPADSGEADAVWAHINKLQTTLAAALVALIFLSLGIILFMGKQMTNVNARLQADRESAQQTFTEFQKTVSPKILSFVRALQAFAATNQSFAPVMDKYRPVLGGYFAPIAPVIPRAGSNAPPPRVTAPPAK